MVRLARAPRSAGTGVLGAATVSIVWWLPDPRGGGDIVHARGSQAAASEAAVKVVLILQNLVFLFFMAALAWIFR